MLGRLTFGVACDVLRRRRASRTLLFVLCNLLLGRYSGFPFRGRELEPPNARVGFAWGLASSKNNLREFKEWSV